MQRVLRSWLALLILSLALASCQSNGWTFPAVLPPSPLPPPLPISAAHSLDDYQFGEPQLLLDRAAFGMVGDWLPDNDRFILVRDFNSFNMAFQEVATFSIAAQRKDMYGHRRSMFIARRPVWLADAQKMAFYGGNRVDYFNGKFVPDHLWITGAGTTWLRDPVLEDVIAMTGKGHTVIAMQRETNALYAIDALTGEQTALPFDLSDFGAGLNQSYTQMLSHPTLPLVAVFDPDHFVILNVETGEQIGIDLGEDFGEFYNGKRWAFDAEWSRDTSWLALHVVNGEPAFFRNSRLFVANASGFVKMLPLPISYVSDMSWAPNGTHLLVHGSYSPINWRPFRVVDLLVDIESGETREVSLGLPGEMNDPTAWSMSWSPDGKRVVVLRRGYIYTIEVTLRETTPLP